jgi:hypothetical protein
MSSGLDLGTYRNVRWSEGVVGYELAHREVAEYTCKPDVRVGNSSDRHLSFVEACIHVLIQMICIMICMYCIRVIRRCRRSFSRLVKCRFIHLRLRIIVGGQ